MPNIPYLVYSLIIFFSTAMLHALELNWSYGTPPEHLVWIEGEDCKDHNWTGETRHNWWHGSAPLSGRGLLELLAWEHPEEGEFFARFPFEVAEAGEYTLYFRGRVPGWFGSPITWQINDGPLHRYPGESAPHDMKLPPDLASWGQLERLHGPPVAADDAVELANAVNRKVALIRLGTFEVPAGRHTLTIRVLPHEEPPVSPVYLAGIDSISIARTIREMPPETLRVTDLRGGPREEVDGRPQFVATSTDSFDPAAPEHKGLPLQVPHGDWREYSTVTLKVMVESDAPVVQGRLRCHYEGSKFRDLVFAVEAKDFGRWLTFEWDLDKEFDGVSRASISSMWLYTYGAWFSRPAEVTWKVAEVVLSHPREREDGGRVVDGRPVRVEAEAPEQNPLDQVVWDVARDAGDAGESAIKADSAGEAAKTLRSGPLRLDLSPANAGVRAVSLGGQTKEVALSQVASAPPVVTARWRSGEIRSATGPARWEALDDGIAFASEDDHLKVRVSFHPDENGEIRIRSEITNKTEEEIDRVRVLPVQGVALGGNKDDDTWHFGTFAFPASQIGPRLRLVSPQQFNHDSVTAYDGNATLHLRWEDKDTLDTESVAEHGDTGVSFALAKFPRIAPGQTWTVPDMVLRADDTGSWHASADRFREWWESWAKIPEFPEWFHGVGGCSPGYTLKDPDAIAKNNEEIANRIASNGLRWGHTPLWIPRGTEGWYPIAFRLTDEEARHMRAATDALRETDARVTTYSNPLMISRLTPEFVSMGREVAVVSNDGFFENTEHHLRHHPMVLPQPSAAYAKRWLEFLEPAIIEGKPDVFYIDQLGAVPLYLDYEPQRHGHEHFGQWTYGQVRFLEVVEETFRPRHPELILMVEAVSAPLMQHALSLFHYGDNRVFRYTFPNYYAFVGYYNKMTDPERAQSDAKSAFLLGLPLLQGWHGVAEMDESVQKTVREIVEMKREIDPRLHQATFRDRLGIELTDEMEGYVFQGEDGGLLVTASNPSANKGRIEIARSLLANADPASAMWRQPGVPEPRRIKPDMAGNSLRFAVPANSIGLLEIPAKQ